MPKANRKLAGAESSEWIPPGQTAVNTPLTAEERPGPAWPGGSSQAEWPLGRQPWNGEGWPRLADGERKPCWKTTVLEDHSTGWPATCSGLEVIKEYSTMQQCEAGCKQTVTCAVWRFGAVEAQTSMIGSVQNTVTGSEPSNSLISSNPTGSGTGACYFGFGDNCLSDTQMDTVGAQRIQHGDVLLLADMTEWEVKGLLNVGLYDHGTGSQAIPRCRNLCYSDVECEYWAYGKDGCWVERPSAGARAQYPLLVPTGTTNTSDFAKTIGASEYIQHQCPPASSSFLGTGDWTWREYCGIAAALLIAIALLVGCFCMVKPKEKRAGKRKTRGLKLVEEEATTGAEPSPETANLLPMSTEYINAVPLAFPNTVPAQPMYSMPYNGMPMGPTGPVAQTMVRFQ